MFTPNIYFLYEMPKYSVCSCNLVFTFFFTYLCSHCRTNIIYLIGGFGRVFLRISARSHGLMVKIYKSKISVNLVPYRTNSFMEAASVASFAFLVHFFQKLPSSQVYSGKLRQVSTHLKSTNRSKRTLYKFTAILFANVHDIGLL